MRPRLTVAALLMAILPGPAGAQVSPFSANTIVPGCRAMLVAAGQPNLQMTAETAVLVGTCIGIVAETMWSGDFLKESMRSCAPVDSNVAQAIRIILKYLDSQPEFLFQDFRMLTVSALHQAWPCR